MSEIANYTFLPWVRMGLANEISGSSGGRATIDVDLTITAERVGGGSDVRPPITRAVEIYGPGDIVGIESSAIIKNEPRPTVDDFEPNYLPYVEFYDEDFLWRYSPVTPSQHRLTPWIALVVLAADEFVDGRNVKARPLPYVKPASGVRLTPPAQLWAWAHVHVDKNLLGTDFTSNDANALQTTVAAELRTNPDVAHSRLVCPRKLAPSTAYHAFVVPTFEAGLLAGLGQDPAGAASHDAPAWTDTAAPQELPYYHRWSFHTGEKGDFEYLVRLLVPQPVDSRVGLRDMDVQRPGANLAGIVDAPSTPPAEQLHGVLKLGGALRIPDAAYDASELAEVDKYRNWATLDGSPTHPFQRSLAGFINLTDSYQAETAATANSGAAVDEVDHAADPTTEYDIANNPDPLITAPLYARWHALTRRLLVEREGTAVDPSDNWVHQLNLDPRWRVAAGYGTTVVQQNQEAYMQAAWEQVGDVLEANRRVREAQVAVQTGHVWHVDHLGVVRAGNNSRWITLASPVHSRVLHDGVTVRHGVQRSKVPGVVFSPQVRQRLAPRGRISRRLPFDAAINRDNLVDRLNSGEVSAAPPRRPPDAPNDEDLAEKVQLEGIWSWLAAIERRVPWLKWLIVLIAVAILLLAILLRPGTGVAVLGVVVAILLSILFESLRRAGRQRSAGGSVRAEEQTPESVAEMPTSNNFRISAPGDGFTPSTRGGDSAEAVAFKQALVNANILIKATAAMSVVPPKPSLDLVAIGTATYQALDPTLTIPRWVWGGITIPERIAAEQDGEFVEAMAYPRFDQPMYKPLAEYSAELFLPNLQHLAENSISLLETNQDFIESYMVGLNHEFARELRWREYPTDLRGTYFRQFWEARGFHDTEGLTEEELKEKLKDIPPIHTWLKRSDLGSHDHREEPGATQAEEVVLVIRGQLLKRYPNAVIYAHRAVWRDDTPDGNDILDIADGQTIDLDKERNLRPLTAAEEANPPRTIVKTPLYEAKIEPDIYFFGFDLTTCEAKGGTGDESEPVDAVCAAEGIEWHDPGWFFVIEERAGEMALGLDVADPAVGVDDVKVWNDLSWGHVTPAVGDGDYLRIDAQTQTIPLQPLNLPSEVEKQDQRDEDVLVSWDQNMSSADLAYVLHQVPVRVAVHAAEMLPVT